MPWKNVYHNIYYSGCWTALLLIISSVFLPPFSLRKLQDVPLLCSDLTPFFLCRASTVTSFEHYPVIRSLVVCRSVHYSCETTIYNTCNNITCCCRYFIRYTFLCLLRGSAIDTVIVWHVWINEEELHKMKHISEPTTSGWAGTDRWFQLPKSKRRGQALNQ